MTTVPLQGAFGQVTLDVNGNGFAKIGPLSGREIWHPENVHVATSQLPATIVNEAQCIIYVGNDMSQPNFRDSTFNGSHGDSTDKINADTVNCGWYIWAAWNGGDAGVVATMTVTGTKDI